MSRPTLRRTPMLERLETRQVLSGVAGPLGRQPIRSGDGQPGGTNPTGGGREDHRPHHAPTSKPPSTASALSVRRPQGQLELGHRRCRRWPTATPRLGAQPRASTRPTPGSRPTRGPAGRASAPVRRGRLHQPPDRRREHLRLRPVGRPRHAVVPVRLGRRRRRPLQEPPPARDLGPGRYREVGIGLVDTARGRAAGHHPGLRQPTRAVQKILGVVYNDPDTTASTTRRGPGRPDHRRPEPLTGHDYQPRPAAGGYQIPSPPTPITRSP